MGWQEILDKHQSVFMKELIEFLSIPSISAIPTHAKDVMRCAEWVASRLRQAKFENVQVFPTGPHACVYGDWLHAPGKPTILIYGHFDVQPVDPIELWDSPPFEPVVKDGRLYARGATDMKANLMLSFLAAEAMLFVDKSLPVNVKFLFEGQEEIGSRDLEAFVKSHLELLACDLIVSPDSIQYSPEQPAMILGTKGLAAIDIDVETAGMDLHSGLYGGGVPNADNALVELLSTFHDKEGRILVEGFFDDVKALTPEERAAIAQVPIDPNLQSSLGIDAFFGEPGYSTFERLWARPTLDINGMWGGYQGDGLKTVIPAQAHAKISCRLVANQEPDRIQDLLEAHVRKHTPVAARVKVTRPKSMARPYLVPQDHTGIQTVANVLKDVYGRVPYYMRIGGSLPITDIFLRHLNAYTVMAGFGQEDERAHSPNEFFRLSDFAIGQTVYGKILESFALVDPASLRITSS